MYHAWKDDDEIHCNVLNNHFWDKFMNCAVCYDTGQVIEKVILKYDA